MYCDDNPDLIPGIKYEFNKYKNVNFFIERVKKYNPNGRNQTLDEAKKIDKETLKFLDSCGESYAVIDGTQDGYDKAVNLILRAIDQDSKTE